MDSDSEVNYLDSESISDVSFVFSDWSIDDDFEMFADDVEEDWPSDIYDPEGVESDDSQMKSSQTSWTIKKVSGVLIISGTQTSKFEWGGQSWKVTMGHMVEI